MIRNSTTTTTATTGITGLCLHHVMHMMQLCMSISSLKHVIKEMRLKACCVAGFLHHHVTTTNACMHVYHLKVDQKQVCGQS